jgi:hypothetical protein
LGIQRRIAAVVKEMIVRFEGEIKNIGFMKEIGHLRRGRELAA